MFKFYNFKTLNSTNDKAKELCKRGLNNIIIVAEKQTKGRGRFNRKWISDYGGLYMTLLLKEKNMERAKYLTLILSIAVAKTIRKLGLDSKVKWPNDVLVKDKKICGILTETISGKENYALVGIGFNVNNKKFPKSIIKKTTSLKIETNEDFNIKKILGMIIGNFNSLYKYYKNNNYGKIISIWKKYSHTLGRKVKVNTLSGIFIGEAIDIDTNCNLILKLKNGKIKKVIEGDIFIS